MKVIPPYFKIEMNHFGPNIIASPTMAVQTAEDENIESAF